MGGFGGGPRLAASAPLSPLSSYRARVGIIEEGYIQMKDEVVAAAWEKKKLISLPRELFCMLDDLKSRMKSTMMN